jgi:hypothetical protein
VVSTTEGGAVGSDESVVAMATGSDAPVVGMVTSGDDVCGCKVGSMVE